MNTAKNISELRSQIESGSWELTPEVGLDLFQNADLLTLGALAHLARTKVHGNKTFYNWNLHLNATNVCKSDCLFCSFARLKTGMPEAYSMSIEEARTWIQKRYRPGMTEIHIVNGNSPDLEFEYYLELLRMIRSEFPELHIKAFTAVEIHHFHEMYGMSYREILQALVDAGLGSLPGGGAEMFASRVRKKICRDKATAEEWLEVHRTAHNMGLRSNCTMLYGTIETPAELINHLVQLRSLQAETGGFQVFIPLAFHNQGNRMQRLASPTGVDDLRVMAISRLMLHNISHIKAYWVMLGIKTAQTALNFGANDFDGTVTEEKIYHMSGSDSPMSLTIADIQRIIQQAGFNPVERDTLYREVERPIDVSISPKKAARNPKQHLSVVSHYS
ncbi:MAG: aminofutalosine synthase MqnE [Bdellovibrionales bacterium]|nr:aminofutalosine synthase MqnE [Bdellovibrionales bacterium]